MTPIETHKKRFVWSWDAISTTADDKSGRKMLQSTKLKTSENTRSGTFLLSQWYYLRTEFGLLESESVVILTTSV